jgi:NAD(P)-dependent dehydrogenase (short-subunit alcohol dehydrogenase family)
MRKINNVISVTLFDLFSECQEISMGQVAVITGGNRGIGFETAKALGAQGINLIIGCRDLSKGQSAAKELQNMGFKAEAIAYDANDEKSPEAVYNHIEQNYGELDMLINNAGMISEALIGKNSSSFVSQSVLQQTFHTNLFAVVALTQELLPLLMKSAAGRIVNVSSIVASLTLQSMEKSPIDPAKAYAYNASKTALNAYTIHLAHELKDSKIKVNSAHPGWVKTELGGPHAPMEIADSYKTSLRLATLDSHGPTGGFFHEADALPW